MESRCFSEILKTFEQFSLIWRDTFHEQFKSYIRVDQLEFEWTSHAVKRSMKIELRIATNQPNMIDDGGVKKEDEKKYIVIKGNCMCDKDK